MRQKSIKSVEKKIELRKLQLVRTKEHYDKLSDDLLSLQRELENLQLQRIASALRKSRKTYQELITFLET